jgi:WD40 repeat protein
MSRSLATIVFLALPVGVLAQDGSSKPIEGTVIRQLGDSAWRLPFWPDGLSFSRDGKTLALAGPQYLNLLDLATGKSRFSEKPAGGSIWSIVWATGDTLYAAGQHDVISHWDAKKRRLVQEYKWHKSVIRRLSLSADGTRLASMDVSSQVAVWEVPKGRLVRTFSIAEAGWPDAALSPDGKTLAASGPAETPVVLYDVETGEKKAALPDGKGVGKLKFAFTPDSKRLIAGGQGTIFVWDVPAAQLLQRLKNVNEDHVEELAISSDGKHLATVGWGEAVRVWNLDTGKLHHSLIAPGDRLKGVAFSPGGAMVAACGDNRAVHRWRTDTGEALDAGPGHTGSVEAVAWLLPGRILTAGKDRSLRTWNADTGNLDKMVPLSEAIQPRLFSADGGLLVGKSDEHLHVVETATGKGQIRLKARVDWEAQLALLSDSTWFAYPVDSKELHLRSIQGREASRKFATLTRRLNALDFSADGKYLAAGFSQAYKDSNAGADARASLPPRISLKEPTVRIYDMKTGQVAAQFGEELPTVARLAFSPDGRYLAIGTEGNQVHVWDLKRRTKLPGMSDGHSTPTFLAFSPDSRRLATVERMTGNGFQVWEVATMTPLLHCNRHVSQTVAVAFSPDGRRVVSCGLDTRALIWDATGIAPAGTLPRLEPDAEELQRLWTQLAELPAARPHHALWQLVASGDRAVAFLKPRLKPTPHAEAKKVKRWLDDLDSGDFTVRTEAMNALQRLQSAIEDDLRRCLEKPNSLEARRRVEQILAQLGPTPERLRIRRAICVLEQIGTPAARDVLCRMAGGDPRDPFTEDARDSLRRLAKHAFPGSGPRP